MDTTTSYSSLHIFTNAISQLQQLHSHIAMEKQLNQLIGYRDFLQTYSNSKKASVDQQPKKKSTMLLIKSLICNISYPHDLLTKDTAFSMKIHNFCTSKIGKVPEAF
jgi:hypothetical protein